MNESNIISQDEQSIIKENIKITKNEQKKQVQRYDDNEDDFNYNEYIEDIEQEEEREDIEDSPQPSGGESPL